MLRTTCSKPPIWYRGSATCHIPRPRIESTALDDSAAAVSMRQVDGTAFGLPVVPDVKRTSARSWSLNRCDSLSAKWVASKTASRSALMMTRLPLWSRDTPARSSATWSISVSARASSMRHATRMPELSRSNRRESFSTDVRRLFSTTSENAPYPAARARKMNSGQFGRSTETQSPRPTPLLRRRRAIAAAVSLAWR